VIVDILPFFGQHDYFTRYCAVGFTLKGTEEADNLKSRFIPEQFLLPSEEDTQAILEKGMGCGRILIAYTNYKVVTIY